MLYEILKHIRNFFPDIEHQKEATFTIVSGAISPSVDIKEGQYFLIEGSVFNDGIKQLTDSFTDETFRGTITPLKIPSDLLNLATEIEDFNRKNEASVYASESFGNYSRTRATNSNGSLASWQNAFATRLNAWRKI